MRAYTVDDIMSFNPCENYLKDRVEELWAGREALTAEDIAALSILTEDKMWLMSRLCADPTNRVARRIALDVVHMWDPPAIVMAWLHTGNCEIRPAAWAAARDAKTILWPGSAEIFASISAMRSADILGPDGAAFQSSLQAASARWYNSLDIIDYLNAKKEYLEWMTKEA